jgi:hypothetical protein
MATYNQRSGVLYVKLASSNGGGRKIVYDSDSYNFYYAYGTFTA